MKNMDMDGRKEWRRKGFDVGVQKDEMNLKDNNNRDGNQVDNEANGTGKNEKRKKREQGWNATEPGNGQPRQLQQGLTRRENTHTTVRRTLTKREEQENLQLD